MEDDTPMGAECQRCGMVNACACEFNVPEVLEWITLEGAKIPVPELENRHLLNIHRMLRQAIEDTKHYTGVIGTCWAPRGEMAQEAFEQEYEHQLKRDAFSRAWLKPIQAELTRRGLTELPLKEPYKPLPEPISVEDVPGGGTILRFK